MPEGASPGRRSASAVLDEYLVVRSQLGDSGAFSNLVRRWHHQLVRHAGHLVGDAAAHDVAQDSWVGIIRGLASLRDPARFRPWALRIVSHKSRDWIRREQSRRHAAEAVRTGGERTPAEVTSEAMAVEAARQASRDDVARVRGGLADLDPNQRILLSWHYLDGMSVREIADTLQVPPGTVKSRLHTARQALRRLLEEI